MTVRPLPRLSQLSCIFTHFSRSRTRDEGPITPIAGPSTMMAPAPQATSFEGATSYRPYHVPQQQAHLQPRMLHCQFTHPVLMHLLHRLKHQAPMCQLRFLYQYNNPISRQSRCGSLAMSTYTLHLRKANSVRVCHPGSRDPRQTRTDDNMTELLGIVGRQTPGRPIRAQNRAARHSLSSGSCTSCLLVRHPHRPRHPFQVPA